jgi:hypothetical protein
MPTLKIDCNGLTLREVNELAHKLRAIEGVESVAIPWKTRDHAMAVPMMSIQHLHMVVKVLETSTLGGAGLKLGAKVMDHAYDKVGKIIVENVGDWVASKFPGESAVEVDIVLYDAEGKLIKKAEGKR